MCGRSGSPTAPFTNGPRWPRSSPSIMARSVRLAAQSRAGPAASVRDGFALCGNHFTQSQSGSRRADRQHAMRMLAGEWNVASCATMARASASTSARSPPRTTRENERSEAATGWPGTVAYAWMKCRNEVAVSGSRSSSGAVSGTFNGVASSCGPVATRTRPKSALSRRRRHIRSVPAICHRSPGAGSRASASSVCCLATSRTCRRSPPR